MKEEIWKPVVGYEGKYAVSDLGRVRSFLKNEVRELKQNKFKKTGYVYVGLYDAKKSVHRLVVEAFIGPIPEGMVVDHIDGSRDNNKLSNLRIVTQRENIRNPNTYEKMVNNIRKACRTTEFREKVKTNGLKQSNDPAWRDKMKRLIDSEEWKKKQRDAARKLNNKPVLQLDKKTGEVIRRWECARDAERELGIASHISCCCLGKRKTAGGYRWRFCQT